MQLRKEAFPPLRDIEDTAQARYHFCYPTSQYATGLAGIATRNQTPRT